MNKRTILSLIAVGLGLLLPGNSLAGKPVSLENYLLGYSYESRKEMKATSIQALDWIEDGKAE